MPAGFPGCIPAVHIVRVQAVGVVNDAVEDSVRKGKRAIDTAAYAA